MYVIKASSNQNLVPVAAKPLLIGGKNKASREERWTTEIK